MNILFVCTGNTCRSPMAAAILSKISSDNNIDLMIDSAGIMAEDNAPASDNAISAMIEMRIDISNHRAHQITNDDIIQADLILTMTEGQKMILDQLAPGKIFTLTEFAGSFGDISDPYGGDLDEYRETAKEIYDVMVDAAEKIMDMMNDDKN